MIDQLNRIPAKISLLSLILNSKPHRKMLFKVLNEAHFIHDISEEKFEGIVGNITTSNHLTFTDDEIHVEGARHNKALHISMKCKDHILAKVLVDNGSSLNVMPRTTLTKLPYDESYIRPSALVVRAFDGSHRKVIGEISLPIHIGHVTFEVVFQVMDIVPAYSCLLGRPWIHCTRALPFTFQQHVKFVVDEKLVIIFYEEDLLVSKPSFQGLEIANATYVKEGKTISKFQPSSASMMVAKVMLENEYHYRNGLGRNAQGLSPLPNLIENKDCFGLGYKPPKEDKRRIAHEKKRKEVS